ncbi:MAG: stage II sporulation protein P [bacterium]
MNKYPYLKIINILLITGIFLFYIFLPFQIEAEENYRGHMEKGTTEVYDTEDNYIFSTARQVTENDKYISEDNIEYVIIKVEENKAIAEKKGKVDLLEDVETKSSIPLLAQDAKKLIAFYHTHNGESYLPGPENVEGKGEIHEIGNYFAQKLEENGIKAIHSEEMHIPHDGAAYTRSRRTALALNKNRPDIIFDLHRDAIPDPEEYIKRIGNKEMTQIRLVIGRQNPNRKVNEQFARHLKAISDEQTPGLIRDIFYGNGEYNQSIHPRALLLEFGTYKNNEDMVKNSATTLTKAISKYIYGGNLDQPAGTGAQNRSAWYTLSWILAIFVIGILTYLYINEGNWQGVMDRIRKFFKEEIIDNIKR